jgi:predicted O-methyltransferase YrrM
MAATAHVRSNPLAEQTIRGADELVKDDLPQRPAMEWIAQVEAVEGWLTMREAQLLARCVAAAAPMQGHAVVEVGSYKGRSTLVLALAVKELCVPLRVVAVDPHRDYHAGDGQDTYDSLVHTLAQHGVDSIVEIVRGRLEDVRLDAPVAVAFIDALHDRASVEADHAQLAPLIVPGGIVAFHDYEWRFPGVVNAVNGLLTGPDYRLAGHAGALVALRRKATKDGLSAGAERPRAAAPHDGCADRPRSS